MQNTIKEVDTKFVATASYFGEEGVSPEDFFLLLHEFNGMLSVSFACRAKILKCILEGAKRY